MRLDFRAGFLLVCLLTSQSLAQSSGLVDADAPRADIVKMVRSDEVQSAGYTGKGVGVAVIDTGYDFPEVPLTAWQDVAEWNPWPVDRICRNAVSKDFGHGTMAAGCVRATAPQANLIAIRHSGMQMSVARAVRWAVANRQRYNIRVINLSVAGGHKRALHAAIREAVAAALWS